MTAHGKLALPVPATAAGHAGLRALLERPATTLLGLDFDGTLAPIVDDPARAWAHPGALPALRRLAPRLGRVAVVTGRPAAEAVRLGRLADPPRVPGLVVAGHYGVERWDAATGAVSAPPPHPGVQRVRAALPGLLARLAAPAGTAVEDKGRSLAVHVRRTSDPATAAAQLAGPLDELARDAGLVVEPGRMVIELRPGAGDKGDALRALAAEVDADVVVFAGDDLGDLPAYEAVELLRSQGRAGLTVCAASSEVSALAERADLVVDGPSGVVAFLQALAARL